MALGNFLQADRVELRSKAFISLMLISCRIVPPFKLGVRHLARGYGEKKRCNKHARLRERSTPKLC